MATRKRKRPARAPRTALGTLAAILLAAFVWAGSELGWFDAVRLAPAATPLPGDGLYVTFIDVGQGDATFASCGGETLLIDAGVPVAGPEVAEYLAGAVQQLDTALLMRRKRVHVLSQEVEQPYALG